MHENAVATCHFNSILWQALACLLIQVVTCLHRLTLLRGLCRTLVVAVLLRQNLFRSQCEAWRRTDEIFLPCCDEYLCSQAFSNVLVFVLQTARWYLRQRLWICTAQGFRSQKNVHYTSSGDYHYSRVSKHNRRQCLNHPEFNPWYRLHPT